MLLRVGCAALGLWLAMGACTGELAPGLLVTAYPLETGRTWFYERVVTVESQDGSTLSEQFADSMTVEVVGPHGLNTAQFSMRTTYFGKNRTFVARQVYAQSPARLEALPTAADGIDQAVPNTSASPHPAQSGPCPSTFLCFPTRADSDPRLVLVFPLRRGNSWLVQAEPVVITRTVEGYEFVQTPAGRFYAARIVSRILIDAPYDVIDWIADEGLLRREVEVEVEDFLFPGNPASERIHEVVELRRIEAAPRR